MNICPFQNGNSKTLTTYESFKRSCLAYIESGKKSAFKNFKSDVQACSTCDCGKKFSAGKDVSLENIPPWIVIIDDTEDKKEILESLKGKLKLKFMLLLIEMAQEKHKNDPKEDRIIKEETIQISPRKKQGRLITQEEKDAVWEHYLRDSISLRALAFRYGISKSSVDEIIREKRKESNINKQIYEQYATGDWTQEGLAKKYGVTRSRIRRILEKERKMKITN